MITYHHIGGRNGTYPLPLKNSPLLEEFHLILYDADANCFEQMKKTTQQAWGKVDVYPYCIGGKTEKRPFYLNFHPTTNSLYRFNEAFNEYNLVNNPLYGEYVFGDACQHMASIELHLLSLEEAMRRSNIPTVDFLSLDVQGAEYDILEGAKSLLQRQCVGIQLEVEFVKLYQDQKTFSDINQLMESMGFELLDLGAFGRCAPISLPIGFRGHEQPLYAEAVYIKKPDELIKEKNLDLLYKGALFSLIYKKLGLCLKFLNKISEQTTLQNHNGCLYQQCLTDIWLSHQDHQHLKFPKLSQLFSNEQFQNYYGLKENSSKIEDKNNLLTRQMKEIFPMVQHLAQEPISPLENILKKYGLDDVSEVVKETRIFETNCFSTLIGNTPNL